MPMARRVILVLVALAAVSCGAPSLPTGPSNKVTPPSGGGGGKYQCKNVSGKTDPWLVEWDATQKARMQATSQGGVLLVKYSGCELEVLYGCERQGQYKLWPTTPASSTEYITSEDDVFAKLPIGALNLAAEFQQGDKWSLDYVVVGMRQASIPAIKREELSGECAEATHYISGMAVGAYQLISEARRKAGGGVTLYGAGAGASSGAAAGALRQDGKYEMCTGNDATADDPRCQAIVQLFLEPVANPVPAPQSGSAATGGASAGGTAGVWEPGGTGGPAADWGWVNVDSNFNGASVLIDGTEIGTTPVKEKRVRNGHHEVVLQSRCAQEGRGEVTVKTGATQNIRVDLKPREGAIRLLSVDDNGKPLKAEVLLGGTKIGETDGTLNTTVFKANVCDDGKVLEVNAKGYMSFSKKVQIKEKKTIDVTAELTSKSPSAQPGSDDEVQQPGTSIYWLRCPVGQVWGGETCSGSARRFTWDRAMQICPAGYKMPTREQFVALLDGCDAKVKSGGAGRCNSCMYSKTCVSMFGKDKSWYWSSSPTATDESAAWGVVFEPGTIGSINKEKEYFARCVRVAK